MLTPPLRSFFSVAHDLIVTGEALPYDLFVNSSSVKGKEKFVRLFPAGEELERPHLDEMHQKYFQLYVAEDQRSLYLRSLVKSSQVEDVDKAQVLKDTALEYLGRIFDKNREFSTVLLEENIEGCREVVENMVDVLDDYSIDDLRGLIGNLSFHDFYTYDHSINVSMYTITLWRVAHPNAPRQDLVNAGLGGLLHDLGKVKIPTHVLNNPGSLSDEEYALIKQHPDFGIELLLEGHVKVHESIDVPAIARIIHEHHENWNGTGYPQKLLEAQISPMARACTIADFFDAITTKRAYSEVLPISDALAVMRKTRGVKVEPWLFDVFERHVGHTRNTARDLTLDDRFDPTLPWAQLPLRENFNVKKEDYGKIHFVDPASKRRS
jgi:HD-GYP domain-containing protein (c-di-GMP phosphodiesterase class II)